MLTVRGQRSFAGGRGFITLPAFRSLLPHCTQFFLQTVLSKLVLALQTYLQRAWNTSHNRLYLCRSGQVRGDEAVYEYAQTRPMATRLHGVSVKQALQPCAAVLLDSASLCPDQAAAADLMFSPVHHLREVLYRSAMYTRMRMATRMRMRMHAFSATQPMLFGFCAGMQRHVSTSVAQLTVQHCGLHGLAHHQSPCTCSARSALACVLFDGLR